MKTKPPKMTEQDKLKQNRGSRFVRVIPSHRYAEYAPEYKYDAQSRRIE